VLDDVSLDVGEHEVVCLIGASGSGKSTLLRCVNLLEPIDEGAILLDGVDVSEPGLDPDPVRRRIGLVFQSYNLFPHMSVLQNVTLAPIKVLGTRGAEAKSQALELLDRFALADKADAYPDQLSGGQQQRVAIVRALAMRPELMLLDEVTAALDPVLVGEVLNVIRQGDQRPRLLPQGRRDPRVGSPGATLHRSESTGDRRVPRTGHCVGSSLTPPPSRGSRRGQPVLRPLVTPQTTSR
jgi:ABC-type polar amino acid transport system ATPase subunit